MAVQKWIEITSQSLAVLMMLTMVLMVLVVLMVFHFILASVAERARTCICSIGTCSSVFGVLLLVN